MARREIAIRRRRKIAVFSEKKVGRDQQWALEIERPAGEGWPRTSRRRAQKSGERNREAERRHTRPNAQRLSPTKDSSKKDWPLGTGKPKRGETVHGYGLIPHGTALSQICLAEEAKDASQEKPALGRGQLARGRKKESGRSRETRYPQRIENQQKR